MAVSFQTGVTMFRHFRTVELRDREFLHFKELGSDDYYTHTVSTAVGAPLVNYSLTSVDCGDIFFTKAPKVFTVPTVPVLKHFIDRKAIQTSRLKPFPAPFNLYVDYHSLSTLHCQFKLKNTISTRFEIKSDALLASCARTLWPFSSDLMLPTVSPSLWGNTGYFEFCDSNYHTEWYDLRTLLEKNVLIFGPALGQSEGTDVAIATVSKERVLAFLANNQVFLRLRLATSIYKLFCVVECRLNNVHKRIGSLPVVFHDGKWLKEGEDRDERLASVCDPSLPTVLRSMTNKCFVAPIPRLIALRGAGDIDVSNAYITSATACLYDSLYPIDYPIPE